MIDENAFGILISYYSIEDDEYSGEPAEFVERYRAFATFVRERLAERRPAPEVLGLDLGFAVYVELADGDQQADLIAWARELRAELGERGYETACVLTHGGRWIDESEARPDVVDGGGFKLVRAALPSEPLRRALQAEAATHGDEDDEVAGWGPGLYVDVEAVEALGKRPKNAPTVLSRGGAGFFRLGG